MYSAHQISRHVSVDLVSAKRQFEGNPRSFFEETGNDLLQYADTIRTFYHDHLTNTRLDGYVVGLSGGLDSSLVATLAVEGAGNDHVRGVLLPTIHTAGKDMDDALELAEKLKIHIIQNDLISGTFESFIQAMKHIAPTPPTDDESNIRCGNVYARLRMIVLRDIAKANNALVLGTGNASERLLGYATIAGDGLGGVDNLGLYHVFKAEVFTLAKVLGMQKNIIEKAPSAGLWPGQTDETELGASYAVLDQILTGYCLGYVETELTTILKSHGIPESVIVNTLTRVRQNSFKNTLPIHP